MRYAITLAPPGVRPPEASPLEKPLNGHAACCSQCVRTGTLIIVLLAGAGIQAFAAERAHPYRRDWKHAMFSKPAIAGTAARAGIAHAFNHPQVWGRGASGFGKRLGTSFGVHAVGTTVEYAVAASLHEDLHYHRSNDPRFGPRLRHALVSTVWTRNTRNGKHRPAVGRLSGHAAAGAVSQAWVPAASGASTAGIGLAADAGANVGREFWPRHHQRRQVRRS